MRGSQVELARWPRLGGHHRVAWVRQ